MKKIEKILANLVIYRANAQNIHWRIYGVDFISLHKYTDKLYHNIDKFIDEIIEKYLQKNMAKVISTTLASFLKLATIKEITIAKISTKQGIDKLVLDGKQILNSIYDFYSEQKTQIVTLGAFDLIFDDLRKYLEKALWILTSSLE